MAKRRGSRTRTPIRRRQGLLPGEFARRSLVAVERVSKDGERGLTTVDNYVVYTRRLDNDWRVEVEHKGVVTQMPHKVVEQVVRHMDSIRKEQRRTKAVETAEMLTRRARATEDTAEQERQRDLKGA